MFYDREYLLSELDIVAWHLAYLFPTPNVISIQKVLMVGAWWAQPRAYVGEPHVVPGDEVLAL